MSKYCFLICVLALSIGCNSVSGKINGESVEIQTAFMIEYDDFWGDDEKIQIILSGSPFNCEDQAEFEEDQGDSLLGGDLLDEYTDNWASNMPEDFWRVSIELRVDDLRDEIDQEHYGIDWDESLADDDEATAVAGHFTDHPDSDDFWSFDWLDTYVSDDGTLAISGHRPGESIRGSFSTTMVDPADGDDEGDVTFRFNATHCRDLERLWDVPQNSWGDDDDSAAM